MKRILFAVMLLVAPLIVYAGYGAGGGVQASQGSYLIYISSDSANEGNINLVDVTNWNTSKVLIKTIELLTDATDYTCVLYGDDGFSTDEVEVMISGHENTGIFLDYPYCDRDNSNEVHFRYIDNVGTATATIKMRGYELR